MGFEYGCGICQTERFGTGVDGDYLQNGGAVTYTGPKHYVNCKLENNAIFGPVGRRAGTIFGQGELDIDATSKLQARGSAGVVGGASRNTIGQGNPGADAYSSSASGRITHRIAGFAGGGGTGGGGGAANKGGNAGYAAFDNTGTFGFSFWSYRAAGVGAGVNGWPSATPPIHADFTYCDITACIGARASAAGGGGIDDIGTGATTGTSGKGGDGGKRGGFLNIRFREIKVAAAGGINANGEDGQDGDDATDSTNLDADCGGGGGGGAGGGGLVRYMCETIDNPGNVQALGGTGGTGGAPVGGGGIGGNGGIGADGIVAPCCLAA